MVANPEKFQLVFLGLKNSQQMCLSINDKIINQCQQVKLLGVAIDSKLNFDEHIFELCGKIMITMSANFNDCPLIWIFSSKAAKRDQSNT